jgi:hypothetical protein
VFVVETKEAFRKPQQATEIRGVDAADPGSRQAGPGTVCGGGDGGGQRTEDFVQMICLRQARQRPNGRCQKASQTGDWATACDVDKGEGWAGVGRKGRSRGAERALRRGRSPWRWGRSVQLRAG